jgi:hypothetical protein
LASREEYEALKRDSSAPVLVGWFSQKSSLACHMFEGEFDALAGEYPDWAFFKVDVDTVPFAAYDCEVVDAPQIAVWPIGKTSDGKFFDKSDLVSVTSPLAKYTEVVASARAVLKELAPKVGERERGSERVSWVFDPATGTSLPVAPQ